MGLLAEPHAGAETEREPNRPPRGNPLRFLETAPLVIGLLTAAGDPLEAYRDASVSERDRDFKSAFLQRRVRVSLRPARCRPRSPAFARVSLVQILQAAVSSLAYGCDAWKGGSFAGTRRPRAL